MAGKKVNIGFYLSVFEVETGYNLVFLEDEYDLKELELTTCEELEFFQISEALLSSRTLNLERISSTLKKSNHVMICISGFLTEGV
jgi:hypothetical protein